MAQRYAVIDTETSGLGVKDQVVEVACAMGEWDGKRLKLVSTFSSLVRPSVPVKPDARAAHHLTDEELAGAPAPEEMRLPRLSISTHVVAHHAPFDVRMLKQTGFGFWIENRTVIDTCHLAKHVWPDAPAYGNQVLRYWLEVAVPGPAGATHRALPDALVTFALLERLLQAVGHEQLSLLMPKQPLLKTCKIGKEWRDKPWAEVDVGMLRWVLTRDFGDDVKHTAQYWLNQKTGKML